MQIREPSNSGQSQYSMADHENDQPFSLWLKYTHAVHVYALEQIKVHEQHEQKASANMQF